MTRAAHEHRIQLVNSDDPVDVRVHEIQAGSRPPVPEQPRLRVLDPQPLTQQRVVEQIDLADRQVVGRAPPRIYECELLAGQPARAAAAIALGRTGHRPILPDALARVTGMRSGGSGGEFA